MPILYLLMRRYAIMLVLIGYITAYVAESKATIFISSITAMLFMGANLMMAAYVFFQHGKSALLPRTRASEVASYVVLVLILGSYVSVPEIITLRPAYIDEILIKLIIIAALLYGIVIGLLQTVRE